MSIFLVTCSSMCENTHVIGVFDTQAAADALAAAPHSKGTCPRSWAYSMFGGTSEAHAATLTGAPPAGAEHSETDHELRVVRMALTGARMEGMEGMEGSNQAWVVLAQSFHIGECFESAVSRAFTSKERALSFLQLPPNAALPTRDGGDPSPLNDTALHGEGRALLRAYPVTGW
jgi:hypothetical protein